MKCKLENRESLISRYLLNELSEEESLKFEEHYFSCEECFNQLRAAEDALNLITNEGKAAFETVKESSSKNIFSFIPSLSTSAKIGFAFAALILIFVLYSVLKVSPDNAADNQQIISQDNNTIQQNVDSVISAPEKQISNDNKLIAVLSPEAFEPNQYYEEWINENVRSVNQIIEKVFSPANSDTLISSAITFKWRMKENLPITLVILNNKEEKVFSSIVNQEQFPDYRFVVNANSKFKSGLYYWKIEDENEVIYVSKFYLVKAE